uniref:Ribosomal protein L5 n=1 Tax=Cyanophora paradoxa TaxID=2762 RepID=E9P1D4_CYAPA|nr:ribosomal protein L5 [Cyanophora paradoxa]ADW79186.1 ribosomal protein L5 [Cyanophora paradoxa]
MLRLQYHINHIVNYELISRLNINNIYKIPKKESIIIQSSQKKLVHDQTLLYPLYGCFELMSFQRPVFSISKNAISAYQLRKKQVLGCKTTLRNKYALIFLDKLIYLYFPKVKALNLYKYKLNQNNINFAFGLNSIIPFEDIENQYSKIDMNFGINVFINFVKYQNINNQNILLYLSSIQFPIAQ